MQGIFVNATGDYGCTLSYKDKNSLDCGSMSLVILPEIRPAN